MQTQIYVDNRSGITHWVIAVITFASTGTQILPCCLHGFEIHGFGLHCGPKNPGLHWQVYCDPFATHWEPPGHGCELHGFKSWNKKKGNH